MVDLQLTKPKPRLETFVALYQRPWFSPRTRYEPCQSLALKAMRLCAGQRITPPTQAFSLSLVNPDRFANDVNNYDNYTELEVELERLLIDVRSMAILSGSEAYSQALLIYKSLQLLSQQNIPGAKGAFEELRAIPRQA